MRATATPEKPTIGSPIRYEVEVVAPAGTEVVVAQPSERIGNLDIVDFGSEPPAETVDGHVTFRRWWKLVAWGTGAHAIESPPVYYRKPGAELESVAPVMVTVDVASVLGDTDLAQTDIRRHQAAETDSGRLASLLCDRGGARGDRLARLLAPAPQRPPPARHGGAAAAAGSVSIGLQDTDEQLFKIIDKRLAQGYKRIKLKIEPGSDVNLARTVRSRYPDIMLMLDANSAYSLEDAEHLAKLDEFKLLMVEQPLAYNDIYEHGLLAKKMKTPICLDKASRMSTICGWQFRWGRLAFSI